VLLRRGTDTKFGSDPKKNEPTRYYPLLDSSQLKRLLDTLNRLPPDHDPTVDASLIMRVIAHALQERCRINLAHPTEEPKNLHPGFGARFRRMSH
jgi:hypothetical protein